MVVYKLPMYAFMVRTGTAVPLPLKRKPRTTLNASVTFTSPAVKMREHIVHNLSVV
jgi:hypothetical protein